MRERKSKLPRRSKLAGKLKRLELRHENQPRDTEKFTYHKAGTMNPRAH